MAKFEHNGALSLRYKAGGALMQTKLVELEDKRTFGKGPDPIYLVPPRKCEGPLCQLARGGIEFTCCDSACHKRQLNETFFLGLFSLPSL